MVKVENTLNALFIIMKCSKNAECYDLHKKYKKWYHKIMVTNKRIANEHYIYKRRH